MTSEVERNSLLNKSILTNFVALILLIIGTFGSFYPKQFFSIGSFALSGALTNWLAVHMLFEKVPGLYGSGIITLKFEDFKASIKHLMMEQFFTTENIKRFVSSSGASSGFDLSPAVEVVDYNKMFNNFIEVVMNSSFGGMLGMFGGQQALEPLREPFEAKMKMTIIEIGNDPKVVSALSNSIGGGDSHDDFTAKIEKVVEERLNELTPEKVKEIVQDMMKSHLGWLVVWGGVFGGVIGFLASFF